MGQTLRPLTIQRKTTYRTDVIDSYLKEVSKYSPIPPEEEWRLIREYRNGDQSAGERIAHANLRFVISVAKQYQGYGIPLPDLISTGNVGLMKALALFNEERKFKFISYAVWWIRQAILEQVSYDRTIRLPLNVTQKNREYKRVHGTDMDEVSGTVVSSLNHKYDEDSGEIIDRIANRDFAQPDDLDYGESMLMRLMKRLPPREQLVIRMKHGIGYDKEHTYREISMMLGLGMTNERIRQIYNKGLRRMKAYSMHVNLEHLFQLA